MPSYHSEDPYSPYVLYKLDVSYFSGKVEAYMRYKEIPHTTVDPDLFMMADIARYTGTAKVPAVKMSNGQWLFDSTPMIQWFEQQYPDNPVLPKDPALEFVALLIEDYGDEWLWRPAMWWRWVPRASRWALGWEIGSGLLNKYLARPVGWYFGRRQLSEWLWDDGVTAENSEAVRDMLFREFEFLEPVLEQQPYLLGSHPSVADYGYFASMFRHFGNDPESAEVMRQQAPNTYEWVARLWNVKPHKLPKKQQWVWPEGAEWQPLLERIVTDYLPYLQQNAEAFSRGDKRFNYQGKTFTFNQTKTTNYRVWCREVLQQKYLALVDDGQARVDRLFKPVGGLQALLEGGHISSGLAKTFELPLTPNESKKRPLLKSLLGQPRN